MTEQELERALRQALRPADPGDDFADRVLARLNTPAADSTGIRTEAAADTDDAAPALASAPTPTPTPTPSPVPTLAPAPALPTARHGRPTPLRRWGLAALLAACVIAGIGLVRWRQQALQWQRGLQARAQLLQALNIASANVNAVRAVVIREEEPMP